MVDTKAGFLGHGDPLLFRKPLLLELFGSEVTEGGVDPLAAKANPGTSQNRHANR
jgi:hypothetical protein